jgi:hypothetical protein
MRRAHTQALLGLIIKISNGNAGHADFARMLSLIAS